MLMIDIAFGGVHGELRVPFAALPHSGDRCSDVAARLHVMRHLAPVDKPRLAEAQRRAPADAAR
jgi:hypothetical protein